MRWTVFCLLLLAMSGASVAFGSDAFPPFTQPTMVGSDPFESGTCFVRGDRVDFAFGAADQLQAAGFKRDAVRIRIAFGQSRSPMHEVIYVGRKSIKSTPPKSTE
jgi:hypothetical protein